MKIDLPIAATFLAAGLALAAPAVLGGEPTEAMRTKARIFAMLDSRDLMGYCEAMHGAAYRDYLSNVCRSAVQNRLRKSEECAAERIEQERLADLGRCRAMPAADFEKAIARGKEAREAYVKDAAGQGIDGERLILQERPRGK